MFCSTFCTSHTLTSTNCLQPWNASLPINLFFFFWQKGIHCVFFFLTCLGRDLFCVCEQFAGPLHLYQLLTFIKCISTNNVFQKRGVRCFFLACVYVYFFKKNVKRHVIILLPSRLKLIFPLWLRALCRDSILPKRHIYSFLFFTDGTIVFGMHVVYLFIFTCPSFHVWIKHICMHAIYSFSYTIILTFMSSFTFLTRVCFCTAYSTKISFSPKTETNWM